MKVRKMIYQGSATGADGGRMHLSVYHLGKLDYEFTCTGRPKHLWHPRTLIDPGMVRAEFADAYKLTGIELKPVLPTRSEGSDRKTHV